MAIELPDNEVHLWWARTTDLQRMRRGVLASYLDVAPAAIELVVGPHGKPSLPPGQPLQFNVSHSGGLQWLAVARQAVGVDVQHHRTAPPAFLAIARRYFAPSELTALEKMTNPQTIELAFYRLWTRKEAMVKALGRGLAFGLARVEVSLQEEGMDCLLSLKDSANLARHWSLGSIPVVEQHYTAAVAVAKPGIHPRVFEWRD